MPRLPQSLGRIMSSPPPTFHGTGKLTLKEIGKNELETGKITTARVMTHQSAKDTLIMSPTGVVGSGNGQSGYWEVTKAEDVIN